jgi:predicted component of type VI protein secretion system
MKCPACGFANEDGVLFCEMCKADLDMPAAAPPAQVPTAMNDPFDDAPEPSPPAEEPIPLEPVTDVSRPAVFDPFADDQAPIELEPVGQKGTVDQGGASDTAADADHAAMPVSPPPLPGAGGEIGNPKLIVVRGQHVDTQYPLYPGKNYLGRTDDKPVDIDLDDQEAPDRIWCSRQHAVITLDSGTLTIEDLNSLNGTFVNRTRVHPGQVRELHENDVIQVGTVHMKVTGG